MDHLATAIADSDLNSRGSVIDLGGAEIRGWTNGVAHRRFQIGGSFFRMTVRANRSVGRGRGHEGSRAKCKRDQVGPASRHAPDLQVGWAIWRARATSRPAADLKIRRPKFAARS